MKESTFLRALSLVFLGGGLSWSSSFLFLKKPKSGHPSWTVVPSWNQNWPQDWWLFGVGTSVAELYFGLARSPVSGKLETWKEGLVTKVKGRCPPIIWLARLDSVVHSWFINIVKSSNSMSLSPAGTVMVRTSKTPVLSPAFREDSALPFHSRLLRLQQSYLLLHPKCLEWPLKCCILGN